MSSTVRTIAEELSALSLSLSREFSQRVPAEVWQAIAARTVDPYCILLIDDTVRATSTEPLHEVNLDNNSVQEMLDMCRVSKNFKAGVQSGFRDKFSGHLYLWFGNFNTTTCKFIKKRMASRIRKIDIYIPSTDTPALVAFRSKWSQFIRSGRFYNLREVRVATPFIFDYEREADLSENGLRTLYTEAVDRTGAMLATAGIPLNPGLMPCTLHVDFHVRHDQLAPFTFQNSDGTPTWLTGGYIENKWRRTCCVPIARRQLMWLWSVPQNQPAST